LANKLNYRSTLADRAEMNPPETSVFNFDHGMPSEAVFTIGPYISRVLDTNVLIVAMAADPSSSITPGVTPVKDVSMCESVLRCLIEFAESDQIRSGAIEGVVIRAEGESTLLSRAKLVRGTFFGLPSSKFLLADNAKFYKVWAAASRLAGKPKKSTLLSVQLPFLG
jgi:hypothetical protein